MCKACHSVTEGGKNKIGPKLWNVMFRPVGSITDYKYSKALSSYGKEWTWEEMNGFLIKPAKWIKGNKMGFAGLKSEKDRASVILYLNQNSDNPNTSTLIYLKQYNKILFEHKLYFELVAKLLIVFHKKTLFETSEPLGKQ